MAGKIDARLAELGIELPEAAASVANYVPYVVSGNLVFVSGQVTIKNGAFLYRGKVGAELSVEQGQDAARLCGLNIIAQGGTACRDGFAEHTAHRIRHPLDPRPCNRIGQAPRREPGTIENFTGVYIADPGDQALIQQSRLDRRAPALEQGGKGRGVELVAQGLETQLGEQGVAL